MRTKIIAYFLVCEGRSTDAVEAARGNVFGEIQRRVVFKAGDFVKEKLGGLHRRTTRYTSMCVFCLG